MRTLDLSAWSLQDLTYLLIATFLAIVLLVIALLFYVRRTRSQPSGESKDSDGTPETMPPPEIIIRRKAWAGRMELVINGRAYRRMKDIEDPDLRRAVMLAVGDLVTFAGSAAPISAAQPPRTAAPMPAAQPPAGKQYAPAKELAEHALLAQLERANLTAPQSQGWMAALGRGLGARRPYGSESRAFVDEIESIVQRRRREKGLKQEVHLRADGQGIVRVEVDGVLYDGPGDITDMAVRELIRAAVGEWEAGI